MTEPKFAVGDRVAVCAFHPQCGLMAVIPATEVVAVDLTEKGQRIGHPDYGFAEADESYWTYRVDGYDPWIPEVYLRPIRPDEYDETPATTERGISA